MKKIALFGFLTTLFLCLAYSGQSQETTSNSITLSESTIVISSSPIDLRTRGKFLSSNGEDITVRQFNDSVSTSRYEYLIDASKKPAEFKLQLKTETIFNFLDKAPPVDVLTSFSGQNFALKGKSTGLKLISFWSLACTPCIAEFPLIDSLKQQFREIEFLGVAIDDDEKVQKKLQEVKLPFTPIANGATLMKAFQVDSFPMHVVLDENNTITAIIPGVLHRSKLDQLINTLKTLASTH